MNTSGLYPNLNLGQLAQGVYWTQLPTQGGSLKTDLWSAFFGPQLGAEQAVWWMAALSDDEWRNVGSGNPALVRARLEAVLANIRARTSAPVYASSVPNLASQPVCKSLQPAFSSAVQVGLDAMIAAGEVLRGPVLPALTSGQKLNRCHPNAAGETVWGQVLLSFFG